MYNKNTNEPDVENYLEEACYHLRKKGLQLQEIAQALELPTQTVQRFIDQYEARLACGETTLNEVDQRLWEDVYNDSLGNEKVTFVRDDNFYHCRKQDLEKMDSTALMSIYEANKKFLDFDMYKPYLDSKPPVGYDPMALQRQVKRATEIINSILETRWKHEDKNHPKPLK